MLHQLMGFVECVYAEWASNTHYLKCKVTKREF